MCNSGYMCDTNIFNRIVDDPDFSLDVLTNRRLFTTHIQRDELGATRNPTRRGELVRIFQTIDHQTVPTAAAVWDVSKWDAACFGEEDRVYERILAQIAESAKKEPRDPRNQPRDALIAVTAIKSGLTLVTNDRDLSQATAEAGGQVITFEEFCALGKPGMQTE